MDVQPSNLVIAHRGASAYLPEHTLEAYVMAVGQGADGIETDVVLSADGVPICLHDLWLETTTDAEEHFGNCARPDGHIYAIELTAEQIGRLRAFGRVGRSARSDVPPMHVPTLEDLLLLRNRLMHALGRQILLLVELKSPAYHQEQGKPLEEPVLAVLERFGCTTPECGVILQSFEEQSLQRLRTTLGTRLPLFYLTAHPLSARQIEEVSTYADGIAASRWLIEDGEGKAVNRGRLVASCHRRGLKLFVWTMGQDERAVRRMFWRYRVDGVITDNPDVAIRARASPPQSRTGRFAI